MKEITFNLNSYTKALLTSILLGFLVLVTFIVLPMTHPILFIAGTIILALFSISLFLAMIFHSVWDEITRFSSLLIGTTFLLCLTVKWVAEGTPLLFSTEIAGRWYEIIATISFCFFMLGIFPAMYALFYYLHATNKFFEVFTIK